MSSAKEQIYEALKENKDNIKGLLVIAKLDNDHIKYWSSFSSYAEDIYNMKCVEVNIMFKNYQPPSKNLRGYN